MNDTIVGMENLPNVFIDKIFIYPTSNPDLIELNIVLALYDKKPPHNSWRLRQEMDLKVHVGYESRVSNIELLNNGDVSLHDHDAIYDPSIRSVTMQAPPVGIQGDYEKYSLVVTKIIKKEANLNVYAACFVDNLGFNNHPVFSKYYGPMVAEQIFVGGELNTLSNYFYYPDTNEEYGGPVHIKPDGSFMEGSEHSDEDHKDLRLVTEENYKIQAYNVNFDIGMAPNNTGDIGSAGNLRDFLGTDRQAGSPPENAAQNQTPRDQSTQGSFVPDGFVGSTSNLPIITGTTRTYS